jgi:hypothetical protein
MSVPNDVLTVGPEQYADPPGNGLARDQVHGQVPVDDEEQIDLIGGVGEDIALLLRVRVWVVSDADYPSLTLAVLGRAFEPVRV